MERAWGVMRMGSQWGNMSVGGSGNTKLQDFDNLSTFIRFFQLKSLLRIAEPKRLRSGRASGSGGRRRGLFLHDLQENHRDEGTMREIRSISRFAGCACSSAITSGEVLPVINSQNEKNRERRVSLKKVRRSLERAEH